MVDREKFAIVTDALCGVGRAVAERLGRDGAGVIVNYRPAHRNEPVRVAGIGSRPREESAEVPR
jgi:NAD(P)-dependent dehydrogenase (short-subunit alcohol dehydrogenase family)